MVNIKTFVGETSLDDKPVEPTIKELEACIKMEREMESGGLHIDHKIIN